MARFTSVGGGSGIPGPQGPQGPAGPPGEGVGPKSWTASNDSVYEIYQASGGIEVETDSQNILEEFVTVIGDVTNGSQILVSVSSELGSILNDIYNSNEHMRSLVVDINGQTRHFVLNGYPAENQWWLGSQEGDVTVFDGITYNLILTYGGAPVIWWDADTLGIKEGEDLWQFRGAKIDYHAYGTDAGSMIGTIYMADDSGDNNITHIETGSGGNDLGTISLWYKDSSSQEDRLYMYRTDGESSTTRIQWTAQVYYSPEVWD